MAIEATTSRDVAAQAWRSSVQVIPSDSHSWFHRVRPKTLGQVIRVRSSLSVFLQVFSHHFDPGTSA